MRSGVCAIRGATTFDVDEAPHVTERVVEMVTFMLERNNVAHDDVISLILTATNDLHSIFPAAAVRTIGWGDVPMMCAQELDIESGTPRCIRAMIHCDTDLSRPELRHVYLHGASNLRDDLPE